MIFNCLDDKNYFKSINQNSFYFFGAKSSIKSIRQIGFKMCETGAKFVHRFLQQVKIAKQHVAQLIELSPESRSECVVQCVLSIELSL